MRGLETYSLGLPIGGRLVQTENRNRDGNRQCLPAVSTSRPVKHITARTPALPIGFLPQQTNSDLAVGDEPMTSTRRRNRGPLHGRTHGRGQVDPMTDTTARRVA